MYPLMKSNKKNHTEHDHMRTRNSFMFRFMLPYVCLYEISTFAWWIMLISTSDILRISLLGNKLDFQEIGCGMICPRPKVAFEVTYFPTPTCLYRNAIKTAHHCGMYKPEYSHCFKFSNRLDCWLEYRSIESAVFVLDIANQSLKSGHVHSSSHVFSAKYSDMFTVYTPSRNLNSSDQTLILPAMTNTKFAEWTLRYVAVNIGIL